MALEWVQGNWTTGPGGSAGPEAEEAGSGSGFGSGHGGTEWAEGGAMLNVIWETEGLQTVGIVVLVCASIKLLHLLGLISFSEGKMWRRSVMRQKSGNLSSQRKLMSSRFLMCFFFKLQKFLTFSAIFILVPSVVSVSWRLNYFKNFEGIHLRSLQTKAGESQ